MLEADIVVIGAGPGGYVCAIRAGQLGLKTVVVEADKVGGECLNYGCIPSKSLITVARLYGKVKEGEKYGLKVSGAQVDLAALQAWKASVVSKLVSGVEGLLKGNHVTTVIGRATVTSKDSVTVQGASGTEVIRTKNLVFATGTVPIRLPGLEPDGTLVITSKEALELTAVPKRLLVVGGGAIGLEFACMYQTLGSQITVVELTDQLLPGSDPDVVRVVHRKLEAGGAKVLLGSKVAAVRREGEAAVVDVEGPGGRSSVSVDKVLLSVGRKPRTEGLGLSELGVATDQRGYILTDRRMATNVQGVYAIGDVRGPPLLAHKANKEGIVAAECAAGLPSGADWNVIPDAVFTDPEVASAGLTEARAKQAGIPVKVARFQFAALGRALASGEGEGFVKLVARADNGLVLGAQIVGPDASNLISEVALAIEMGATVEDMALTVHPHPTLPEALMEAAESAAGTPVHQLKL